MVVNSLIRAELATRSPFAGPHPLNRGFRWVDHVGPWRFLTAEQIAHYDRQGFLVLEDVFSSGIVGSLISELAPLVARAERFHDATFALKPVLESKLLREFCRSQPFRDLSHDLLGLDVRLYWDQAVYKAPGHTSFSWHQDNGYQYVEPQQYLTCWLALSDATELSGCPWVYPGVHRSGTLQHRQCDYGMTCVADLDSSTELFPGAEVAPVRAGGMVVFSSLTPHATGPNRSSDERKAYILQFAPSGAEAVTVDGRRPCTSAAQFPILVGGAAPLDT